MGKFDNYMGVLELGNDIASAKRFTLTLRDVMLLRDAVDVVAPATAAETKAVDRLRRILHEAVNAKTG
jgi:hypothetical protein